MQQSQWEIIILRPSPVFFAFLASQMPGAELPNLDVLQTDATAYVIRKQTGDEATLDEIERHFSVMFRHEISRWLGARARNVIEGSFFDFLCCFKFELHSHMMLMEPSIQEGQQLLCIKPRSALLQWMKSVVEEQSELATTLQQVSVTQLAENSTVVIKNFKQLSEIKPFMQAHYLPIFKAEMRRMADEGESWPDVDAFQKFTRYFKVEIHTRLIHLH